MQDRGSRIIVFGMSCLFIGFLAGAVLGVTFSSTARNMVQATKNIFGSGDRYEQLRRSPPQGSVAMIGDSHIEAGAWQQLLGPDYANYGIGGDTTAGLLNRVNAIKAKRAVLMIGVNDAIRGEPIDRIAKNVAAILEKLAMPVTLLSIMPGVDGYEQYNPAIVQANSVIKALCQPPRCQFVDTWQAMSTYGKLDPTFSADGLHLNSEGYRVLARLIVRALAKAEEEP